MMKCCLSPMVAMARYIPVMKEITIIMQWVTGNNKIEKLVKYPLNSR